jgi:hypothetical protein
MGELRRLIREQLDAAVDAGELATGVDTERLADALEVVYNGALITWAIHRDGSVETAMRRAVEYALDAQETPRQP